MPAGPIAVSSGDLVILWGPVHAFSVSSLGWVWLGFRPYGGIWAVQPLSRFPYGVVYSLSKSIMRVSSPSEGVDMSSIDRSSMLPCAMFVGWPSGLPFSRRGLLGWLGRPGVVKGPLDSGLMVSFSLAGVWAGELQGLGDSASVSVPQYVRCGVP